MLSLRLLGIAAFAQLAWAQEAEEEWTNENPTYNYAYQVSDDESHQTYIAHQEGREDNVVTGQYSYVDAYGALITVTYIADSNGYREERTVEANYVQNKQKKFEEIMAGKDLKGMVEQLTLNAKQIKKKLRKLTKLEKSCGVDTDRRRYGQTAEESTNEAKSAFKSMEKIKQMKKKWKKMTTEEQKAEWRAQGESLKAIKSEIGVLRELKDDGKCDN